MISVTTDEQDHIVDVVGSPWSNHTIFRFIRSRFSEGDKYHGSLRSLIPLLLSDSACDRRAFSYWVPSWRWWCTDPFQYGMVPVRAMMHCATPENIYVQKEHIWSCILALNDFADSWTTGQMNFETLLHLVSSYDEDEKSGHLKVIECISSRWG